jgi:hypothetical protein
MRATRELGQRPRKIQTTGRTLATQTMKGTRSNNKTPSRNPIIGEDNRPTTRPEPAGGPSTVAGLPQGGMRGEKEVTGMVHLETTPTISVEKETGGGMVSTKTGAEDRSEEATQAGAPSAEALSAEVLLAEAGEVHREEVHLEAGRRAAGQGDHPAPTGEVEDEAADSLQSDRAHKAETAVCSGPIRSKRTTFMTSAGVGDGTLWYTALERSDYRATPHPGSTARALLSRVS